MYYRIAEDAEERLMDPVRAFDVQVRALKECPLDERTGEEVERLAGMIDGGWEQLANAYADVLGVEGNDAAMQASIGKRLARVFEEELADVDKAEETYRYVLTVVPSEVEALANLDRIYSLLEQWPELAGVLEQRAEAAEDARDKVELNSRLGQVYEEQLGRSTTRSAPSAGSSTSSSQPTRTRSRRSGASTSRRSSGWSSTGSTSGSSTTRRATSRRPRSARRWRASRRTRLGKVEEAIETWKRVLDLRGEDPEALWALANLYEQRGKWAELSDVLERHFDIAESDEDRVNILTRRARLFSEQLERDDEALETWQRVLDIDFANVASLRAIAQIWRVRQDPRELVAALHASIDRAAALLDPTELVAIYRELGKTYGQVLEQPFDSAEAWRNLLEVDPNDFEAMDELEASTAPRSAGPRWSTSRCDAPRRSKSRRRRSVSCSR